MSYMRDIDFQLTEQQELIRKESRPLAARSRSTTGREGPQGRVSDRLMRAFAQPAGRHDHSGRVRRLGGDEATLMLHRLRRRRRPSGASPIISICSAMPVIKHGSEELKRRYCRASPRRDRHVVG